MRTDGPSGPVLDMFCFLKTISFTEKEMFQCHSTLLWNNGTWLASTQPIIWHGLGPVACRSVNLIRFTHAA